MGDHDVDQRIRLVALGGGGVGKTSIIKRFLVGTFDDKHRSTVEDLYYYECHVGPLTIKVDILDTAGDLQFPAMRRLSVATANAFLLVYSVTSSASFDVIKQCFEEIREQRADFQDIPTVVVGNKTDCTNPLNFEVRKEDAAEWVYCELPRMRTKVLECSAKTGSGVAEVFRAFLHLARLPLTSGGSGSGSGSLVVGSGGIGGGGSGSLKRRSSEYGGVRGDRRPSPSPLRGVNSSGDGGGAVAGSVSYSGGDDQDVFPRLKPRSRSLIRRSSKKTPKLGGPSAGVGHSDDCTPS